MPTDQQERASLETAKPTPTSRVRRRWELLAIVQPAPTRIDEQLGILRQDGLECQSREQRGVRATTLAAKRRIATVAVAPKRTSRPT